MTARIPVTPEVHQTLKDMANGAEVTFDDLLRHLMDQTGIEVSRRDKAFKWGMDHKGQIPEQNGDPK